DRHGGCVGRARRKRAPPGSRKRSSTMASKDDLFSVADQVVLVSGGSRGIGRAIAQGFAQRGARVIITGREEKSLAATAAEISVADRPAARGLVCDVADAAAVKRLAETAIAEFGHIDTL